MMLYRDEKIRINFCSHTTYSIHTWIYKTRNVSHLNKTLYNVYSHEIVLENRRWCKVHSRYLPLFFTHTSDCVKASHFFRITASSIALVVWDGNHKHEYKTQTLLFKKKKKKCFCKAHATNLISLYWNILLVTSCVQSFYFSINVGFINGISVYFNTKAH